MLMPALIRATAFKKYGGLTEKNWHPLAHFIFFLWTPPPPYIQDTRYKNTWVRMFLSDPPPILCFFRSYPHSPLTFKIFLSDPHTFLNGIALGINVLPVGLLMCCISHDWSSILCRCLGDRDILMSYCSYPAKIWHNYTTGFCQGDSTYLLSHASGAGSPAKTPQQTRGRHGPRNLSL